MHRDLDLVRKILLKVEEEQNNDALRNFEIQDYSRDQVAYHVEIMNEAGLLKATVIRNLNSFGAFSVSRLTWDGHEFIDAARNEDIWNKTKEQLNKVGGWTMEVAKLLLIDYLKSQLRLP